MAYCTNCGMELSDEARFCSSCGTAVSATQPVPEEEKNEVHEQTDDKVNEQPQPPASEEEFKSRYYSAAIPQDKPKKSPLIPIIIAVLVLGLIAGATVLFIMLLNRDEPTLEPVYATIVEDNAYICYDNGKTITINGEIEFAFITANRKKVVVLEKKGDLYWTDPSLSTKHVVAAYNASKEISVDPDDFISNRFLVYEIESIDKEDANYIYEIYRYEFETDKAVKVFSMSDTVDDVAAPYSISDDLSFVVAKNGKIRLLAPDSDDFETIVTYALNSEIQLCGVSSDGKTISYVIDNDGDRSLNVYYNGSVETVLKDADDEYYYMESTPGSTHCVIYGDTKLVICKEGSYVTVSIPGNINEICTSNGLEMGFDTEADDDNGFFVTSRGDNENSLYYIEYKTGLKYKLLSKASKISVYKDVVVYQDENEILYCAELDLKKHELSEQNRIGSDIEYYRASTMNSSYIYYEKNENENYEFDLYVYDVKNKMAVKIAEEVYNYRISIDGQYVFYLSDISYDSENYKRYGTFMVYNSGKNESEKISDDVLAYSYTSGIITGEIDPHSFFFEVYQGKGSDSFYFDICYYNGKKTETVFRELEN